MIGTLFSATGTPLMGILNQMSAQATAQKVSAGSADAERQSRITALMGRVIAVSRFMVAAVVQRLHMLRLGC